MDWNTIQISGVGDRALMANVGRTIEELARASGREAFETFRELLIADDLATTILHLVGHEENVRAIMRHPAHTGGSDGLLVGTRPHPRAWGTFPRYLGHYTRELGVLGLEECVKHLTGNAARRLRLRDRGLIRTGYAADLVLFEAESVRDTATYDEPRQQATGIEYVFVNGVATLADGKHTGALAGRALRRSTDGLVGEMG
jgi:N-acyl-D-amino-acid deacylase